MGDKSVMLEKFVDILQEIVNTHDTESDPDSELNESDLIERTGLESVCENQNDFKKFNIDSRGLQKHALPFSMCL